jgi:hypothetical protein
MFYLLIGRIPDVTSAVVASSVVTSADVLQNQQISDKFLIVPTRAYVASERSSPLDDESHGVGHFRSWVRRAQSAGWLRHR